MCGIAGLFSAGRFAGPGELDAIAERMAAALRHRGPDDHGTWTDGERGVALAHSRLSIIDLSAAGHQPMCSADGRYVLVLNGEIYNHAALRQRLPRDHAYRGHSDTEVALLAIQTWGLDKAIEAFIGMFALALWDRQERTLTLARDRLGEKPLYYGTVGDTFLFGSELRALRCFPGFGGDIDREALTLLLRHNYVPSPWSIFENVRKLPAASICRVNLEEGALVVRSERYWSLAPLLAARPARTPTPGQAREELDALLAEVLAGQSLADVPLGAFLSGGVDSSLVVAAMQAQSRTPVRTYSIGFEAGEFDEAPFASAVAKHLRTDHTELYASNAEVLGTVPRLAEIYDEPFADSSQIPTFLVSTLARQHVTVALSGDGGDELFGGYLRYFAGRRVWDQMQLLPRAARKLLAGGISAVPIAGWDRLAAALRPVLPGRYRYRSVGQKAHKVADVLRATDPDAVYLDLVSLWKSPAEAVRGGRDASIFDPLKPELDLLKDFSERMMFADTMTYLPDDLLVKVDRASMAVGLEVRAPFLDHRVVEFAWRQPVTSKIDKLTGKKLLKDLLYEYVPRELVERPKMGFGVPLADWLRGPLREWAGDLLAAEPLQRDGYFLTDAIQQKWREHLRGEADWHYQLWPVLMFQAWLDAYER